MLPQIRRWINERWPLDAVIRWSLEEEMQGGTSYAYVFGSAVFLTFLLQVVTGIFQFVYLVPTVDHAYDSLNYLRIEVPFGWLIHGLHYWGAAAMLILVGLHMCANFIFGAYKHPRQLTWIIGVCLLLATQAQVFTGPVLPWDERGYWEGEVGTSIVGTTPIIGDFLKRILRGGATLSQLTLSRFFVLHAAIIPALLLALIPLHVVAFRRFGVAGPWDEAKRHRIGYFWPDQVFKDAIVFAFVVVALIGISVYFPPPIAGPADPLDTSYVPKPEWNFLFLYQALKFFHGMLEPVGTVGLPLLLILLLGLLPFYDRNPDRNPARRPFAMVGGGAFVAIVLTLAYVGYYSKPGAETAGPAPGPTVSSPATKAVSAVPASADVKEGAQLFQSQGCIGCHRIHGVGGTVGPDLSSGVLKGRDREWLITQIRNPKAHFPNSIMPSFTGPSDQQVNAVVDYLLSTAAGGAPAPMAVPLPTAAAGPPSTKPVKMPPGPPGQAAYVIGSPERGVIVYTQVCISCHGPLGTDNIPNPGSADGKIPPLNPINRNLFSQAPQTFAQNIDRFIQHGSVPEGPNPQFQMLAFGDDHSLTQQAISNVEAYVMQLNGVDRAELLHPGLKAQHYFWVVVIVFGAALAVLRVRGTLILPLGVILILLASPAELRSQDAVRGKENFDSLCAACHTIGGGARVGPDLKDITNQRSGAWLGNFISNPDKMIKSGDPVANSLLKEFNGLEMPNLGLSPAKVADLLAYLKTTATPIKASAPLPQAKTPAPPVQAPAAGTALPPGGAAPQAQTPAATSFAAGSAEMGAQLFSGMVAFEKGGPACISCHDFASLRFPGGGTLGPDLTRVLAKFGAGTIDSVLAMLPFPTMKPLFDKRPLTIQEQRDLAAFFQKTGVPSFISRGVKFGLSGIGGLIILILLTWVIWQDRLVTVRKELVGRSGKTGGTRI